MPRLCLLFATLAFAADPRAEQVDRIFSRFQQADSPGCAVGVYSNGEPLLQKSYGYANLELGAPITPQSRFYLASVSKQLAAAAVVQLAAQGKLQLDDSVRKHFPEFSAPWATGMTVRHLLHHQSGIRDYLSLQALSGRPDNYYTTEDEVVRLLARQKTLNFRPGDEYLYSNSGYVLLSILVRRVTGKSLRDYTRENIFQPLGMSHTVFADNHNEVLRNRATGYTPAPGGGWRINAATLDVVGDGGAFSSLEDLAKWDRNFLNNRLRPPDLIERMGAQGILNSGQKSLYAAGLGVQEYRGLGTVGHSGGFRGYSADRLMFPSEKFSVLVLCNASDANAAALSRRVADVYLEGRLKPAAPEVPKPVLPKSETSLSPAQLARYAGEYYSEELDTTFEFVVRDKTLWLKRSFGPDGPLQPVSRDTFRTGGATFAFERDVADNIAALRVSEPRARNIAFERRKR
ncbi:MAG: serine hydrolase [Bryobacteraceae bacterium]|nr:serine hydrolase [Bryobacteraceae bacterium]